MARKKKEEVTESKIIIEEKPKIKETPILQVVTYDEVYLREKPLLDNTNKNIVGKMVKGKIYDVAVVITFSVKKMYRLKEGQYVITDEVKVV